MDEKIVVVVCTKFPYKFQTPFKSLFTSGINIGMYKLCGQTATYYAFSNYNSNK